MRFLFFRTAYPAAVIGLVSLAWWSIYLGVPIAISGPVLFTVVVLAVFLLEWFARDVGSWQPSPSSLAIDGGFLATSFGMDVLGRWIAVILGIKAAQAFGVTTAWNDSLTLVVEVPLGILIYDFFSYWFHRASHVGNPKSKLSTLLWQLHSIHHLPDKLYGFNNIRMHPLNQLANSLIKLFPLVILGFSESAIFLVGFTSTVLSFFAHANCKLSMGPCNYFVTTPWLHRFHHSRDPKEAKNFGSTIMLWDQVFGTWHHPAGTNMSPTNVGVAHSDRFPSPESFIDQLVFPTRLSRVRARETAGTCTEELG